MPTGSLGLDTVVGNGGIVRGKILELYGPESAGKTTLSLYLTREAQKNNGLVVFIDAEHCFDKDYAEALGVDIDSLVICQPDSAEEGYVVIDKFARSGEATLIIVDSLAAMTPKGVMDLNADEHTMNTNLLQSRLNSSELKKLASILGKSDTILLFINQERKNVSGYGPPNVTPGGVALRFYASYRIEIRKTKTLKHGDIEYAIRSKITCKKNKQAVPYKRAEVDIKFGKGIVKEAEVLDYALDLGIIEQSGAWFSYGEEKIGQGRESVCALLEENKKLCKEIEKKILSLN